MTKKFEKDFPVLSKADKYFDKWMQQEYLVNSTALIVRRNKLIGQLDLLISGANNPLFITGVPGIGKSVLLAQWVQHRRQLFPDELIVYYSAEASGTSMVDYMIWADIHDELESYLNKSSFTPKSSDIAVRIHEITMQLALEKPELGKPIIVFDGIDKVQYGMFGAKNPLFLLDIAQSCRLVLSATGRPEDFYAEEWGTINIEVDQLDDNECKTFLSTFFMRYGKQLGDDLEHDIVNVQQARLPRYLNTLLEELRIFGSHEQLKERVNTYLLANTLTELYDRILERIESDYETDRPNLVKDALANIYSVRSGVTEEDLLSILGTSTGSLPIEWWAPIRLALREAIGSWLDRLRFTNEHIKKAVELRYIRSNSEIKAIHRHLAIFYLNKWQATEQIKENYTVSSYPGAEEETLWQLNQGECWDQLAYFLSDLHTLKKAWRRSKEDVILYWNCIEKHSAISLVNTYAHYIGSVLEFQSYPEHFLPLVELLIETQHEDMITKALDFLSSGLDNLQTSTPREIAIPSLKVEIMVLLGRFREAIDDLKMQEEFFRSSNDYVNLELAIRKQGDILIEQQSYEEALLKYQEGIEICRTGGLDKQLMINFRRQITPSLRLGKITYSQARQLENIFSSDNSSSEFLVESGIFSKEEVQKLNRFIIW